MRKTLSILIILSFVVGLATMTGCARRPTPNRVRSLSEHHFKKYGNKYPETIYGQHKVKSIEIISSEELHKYLVAVVLGLTFDDQSTQEIRMTLEKKAFGWQMLSWEVLR